jgi:Sulphur transport
VAAVDELLSRRQGLRLLALAEASLWVGGGLAVMQALHRLPGMPAGYAAGAWTLAGGVLLGLGAWVNRACVFGAIARLGSGEWAYLLTPLGFYVGCLSVGPLFAAPPAQRLAAASPLLQAPALLALPFGAFVAWRLRGLLRGPGGWRVQLWLPHQATLVIGVTFFAMLVLVDAWAYTDVLVELARGMATSLVARVLLLLALLGGAAFGGLSAERWKLTRPTPLQLARCFGGGVLMGWGSLLIPGGNDGLILVGMPLLWPYAWLAFGAMCAAIAAAQLLQRAA